MKQKPPFTRNSLPDSVFQAEAAFDCYPAAGMRVVSSAEPMEAWIYR